MREHDRLIYEAASAEKRGDHEDAREQQMGWPTDADIERNRVNEAERELHRFENECAAMEDFLRSVGYVELDGERWQDKRGYQPPKPLKDAYDFEMTIFI